MALFTTDHLAELRKLQAARAKLEADDITDRARLAELRASQANVELAQLLGDSDSGAAELRGELATLEARISGRQAAKAPLLQRIREAITQVAHGKAETLRSQAALLRKKYDAHLSGVVERLKALEEFAGIGYQQRTMPVLPPGTAFLPGEYPMPVPRGMVLAEELRTLTNQADNIELGATAAAAAGGQANADSLAGLLTVAEDFERLTPGKAAITAWFLTASARADAAWQRDVLADFPPSGGPPPARRLSLTVVWDRDGTIDLVRSAAINHTESPFSTGSAQAAERAFIAGHRLSAGAGAGRHSEG